MKEKKMDTEVMNDIQTADSHSNFEETTFCRLVGEKLEQQDAAHLLNHNPEEQNVP